MIAVTSPIKGMGQNPGAVPSEPQFIAGIFLDVHPTKNMYL